MNWLKANTQHRDFNLLDVFIRYLRVRRIKPHIHDNLKVLDLGCGSDVFTLMYFKEYIESGIGIDEIIKMQSHDNLELIQQRIDKELPFEEKQFNMVITLAFIEHLEHPDIIIKECFRILEENGTLLLTTPSIRGQRILEIMAFKLNLISKEELNDHKNIFSIDELRKLIEANGFETLDAKTFLFGLNNFIHARRPE